MPDSNLRFEPYDKLTLFGRRYYARVVNEGNSEIEWWTEGYNDSRDRDLAISRLQLHAANAKIRKGKPR